jgi:hypothetical protein
MTASHHFTFDRTREGPAVLTHTKIEDEIEKFRQFVISSRDNPAVAAEADACAAKLNELYKKSPDLFTDEDKRFLNVLRGRIAVRLAAHQKGGPYAPIAKPKGVKLDHCWRCETPLDERFTEFCPECSTKTAKAFVCPVCQACGCQAAGKVLV